MDSDFSVGLYDDFQVCAVTQGLCPHPADRNPVPQVGPHVDVRFVLHLFSGQRRIGDFQDFFDKIAGGVGVGIM
eukprot:787426-Karenia_brevis.AAC.1